MSAFYADKNRFTVEVRKGGGVSYHCCAFIGRRLYIRTLRIDVICTRQLSFGQSCFDSKREANKDGKEMKCKDETFQYTRKDSRIMNDVLKHLIK